MKNGGKRRNKVENKTTRIERLPPTAPAARDEGPRLIPLEDRISEPSRLDHYLDLADAALGVPKEDRNPGRRRIDRNSR
jgi:hypothetical protein